MLVDMKRMRSAIPWILAIASLAALAAHYVINFIAVDSCLDSGGVFDYADAACRFDVTTLPYSSYSIQYRSLIWGTLILAVVLLAWGRFSGRWNRRPGQPR